MKHKGQCHCGAVQFEFEGPAIDSGVRCNCSFCMRRGAVMSNFLIEEDALTAKVEGDNLGLYEFRNHVAKHHFCKQCGIYTFHRPSRAPDSFRVNLACIDGINTYALPIELIDGAAL